MTQHDPNYLGPRVLGNDVKPVPAQKLLPAAPPPPAEPEPSKLKDAAAGAGGLLVGIGWLFVNFLIWGGFIYLALSVFKCTFGIR